MNQKVELIKNTVIIAIGKLSTQILSFLLLPLYTAQLSPSEYGTYDFLVTLSVFLLPIITLLMEESMFRFLIDADDEKSKKKVITQTIKFTVIGTVIFSIVAIIAVYILNNILKNNIATIDNSSILVSLGDFNYGVLFIFFVISNILIGLSNSLSRGLGKIKLYSLSNFVLGLSTILLNLFFILVVKAGVIGLLFANTIANTLTALYIFKKLKLKNYISFKTTDSKLQKEMIKYSVPLVPNSLSWIIINLSDRIIITAFMDSAANGIYSIANKFPYILNTVYGFFYTAWKESAAKILKQENKVEYYNSIYKDMKKILFAAVLCLIAVMPIAFPIFVNAEYNEAYKHIPMLILATYFANLSSFYGGIFSAYKNTKIMGTTTVAAAIINILINVLLIKYIGLYAAVISTFVSNLIIYWYRKRALKLLVKLKEMYMVVPYIILGIVIVLYYMSGWWVRIIQLVIAISYSIFINKSSLSKMKTSIKNKFSNKSNNDEDDNNTNNENE